MKVTKSSQSLEEKEIYNEFLYYCLKNGAEKLAYPPVIAGGSRANIIHYLGNDQLIKFFFF